MPITGNFGESLKKGEITFEYLKNSRFQTILGKLGIVCSDEQSVFYNNEFFAGLEKQKELMPFAIEALDYLKNKYSLHIITNGFLIPQALKLKNCGLYEYFTTITTADLAESKKLDRIIFDFALELSGADRVNSVYIGDDGHADKIGAKNAEIPFIHFNIHATESNSSEIKHLSELLTIL